MFLESGITIDCRWLKKKRITIDFHRSSRGRISLGSEFDGGLLRALRHFEEPPRAVHLKRGARPRGGDHLGRPARQVAVLVAEVVAEIAPSDATSQRDKNFR